MRYAWVLLFFMACNAQKGIGSKDQEYVNADKGLVLLLRDTYSGQAFPEPQIIKEATTLQKFFAKINKTKKPGLAVPKIDFEKEIVVVYSAGEQMGVAIPLLEIEEETLHSILLKVRYQNDLSLPGSQEITTSPFCMYTLPKTHKEIIFSKMD